MEYLGAVSVDANAGHVVMPIYCVVNFVVLSILIINLKDNFMVDLRNGK